MLLGTRLRQLRLAAGLSLDALASAMGDLITKQALSKYETGKSQPTQVVLNKLALALDVKASGLTSEPDLRVDFHGFRKRTKLGKRAEEEIKSKVAWMLEQRIHLQKFYKPLDSKTVPYECFGISSLEDVETAAGELRAQWMLGDAPIADVTNTLEEHLVHVLELQNTDHFDGLSATAKDESGNIIGGAVVSCHETSGERQRFNLGHELGHLVLKVSKEVDVEDAANRFAAAFLAPKETFLSLTGLKRHHLTLNELLLLKQRLGLSLQALVYRMKDLGVISATLHKQLCIDFSRQGWRKSEPGALPREEPKWFRRAILQAVTESWITKEDGERMLGETIDVGEPLTLEDRRVFMKLPLEERRNIMAKQAEDLAEDYKSDSGWKEIEGSDFIEY